MRHFFGSVVVRRSPLRSHHLSLYAYIEARDPNDSVCRNYLARRGLPRYHA